MDDGGQASGSAGGGDPLPLPGRDAQTHLEPQLREPGSAGSGTPFAAFDAAETTPQPRSDTNTEHPDGDGSTDRTATGGAGPVTAGRRAAAFRAAARRAAHHRRR